MSVLADIRTHDDPILRQRSADISIDDAQDVERAIEALKAAFSQIFQNHKFTTSAGLSFVQLGILKRACIIWLPGGEPFVMLNPVLEAASQETDYKYEGCLCFFDQRGLVPRHSRITASYFDEQRIRQRTTYTGWAARIVQHEIDHMNGILYPDRMDPAHILIDLQDYARIKPFVTVQNLAKDTLFDLLPFVREGVTERHIADKAGALFREKGITDFWYYNIAALVTAGDRTTLSLSGRDYKPSDQAITKTDSVTIDLSPSQQDIWGDYARTIYMLDGEATLIPQTQSQKSAAAFQAELHETLLQICTPDMTVHDLWAHMNDFIQKRGFENLDYRKNLGHSIESHMADRRYIEKGNNVSLSELGLFTFEPHIKARKDNSGYKHENIYYFTQGRLQPI